MLERSYRLPGPGCQRRPDPAEQRRRGRRPYRKTYHRAFTTPPPLAPNEPPFSGERPSEARERVRCNGMSGNGSTDLTERHHSEMWQQWPPVPGVEYHKPDRRAPRDPSTRFLPGSRLLEWLGTARRWLPPETENSAPREAPPENQDSTNRTDETIGGTGASA